MNSCMCFCVSMSMHTYVVITAVMIHLNAVSDLVKASRFCWKNASLPASTRWPCEWSEGRIPYTFDLYSLNKRRLIMLVKRGLNLLEQQSCLKFEERNPLELANRQNYTYLVYTYSEVLEYCCNRLYHKPIGRRNILLTPLCSLSVEIAHTTLHGLGLSHKRDEPFNKGLTEKILFLNKCKKNTLQNYKVMLRI